MIIGFYWLSSGFLNAQQQVLKLDLGKAIELGIANSKVLKASSQKINIAQAKIRETNTQTLPQVKVSSTYTRISDNITPFSVKFPGAPEPIVLNPQILNQFGENLGASQLLYAGGRVKKTIQSLAFLEKAAELDLEKDRSDVVYNIISAYYTFYKLQQSTKILRENAQLVQARLVDLKNLEDNGVVLHNDVLKLELQLSQLNIQQLDISNAYASTQYGFNILLGLPDSAQTMIDSSSFFKYQLNGSYADYEKSALENRPDLTAVNTRLKAADLNIAINKANFFPTISASTNLNYLRPNPRIFPQKARFDGTWNAGISVAWDVSSLYNNKHFVQDAQYNYELSHQLQLALVDNIKTELYANYLAYKRAQAHLVLTKQILAQADENYRLIYDRLQDNLVIATDLQDALTNLIQGKLNVLIDEADLDLAYFKFIKTTGNLSK
ncbi:MAG: TolC family protein [Bacteroidota bacterium]